MSVGEKLSSFIACASILSWICYILAPNISFLIAMDFLMKTIIINGPSLGMKCIIFYYDGENFKGSNLVAKGFYNLCSWQNFTASAYPSYK